MQNDPTHLKRATANSLVFLSKKNILNQPNPSGPLLGLRILATFVLVPL